MKAKLTLLLLVCASCSRPTSALDSIDADSLLASIKTLSSDDFEGRKPGSEGEKKTLAWLEQEFKGMGLTPVLQKVPLAGIASKPDTVISVKGKKLPMTNLKDFVATSQRFAPEVKVDKSPIVFVGYGVVAPEYNWDDYKDVDVKGKTILMLVNDPALPDEKMFKGKAMTYYGRWTYKYEIATQKGAAAAIIIHETGPAGYPFEVVSGSWGGENFDIQHADNNMTRVPVQAWMTYDKTSELCRMAGLDLAELKKAALRKDFKPIALAGATASFKIENTLRTTDSNNVLAKLEGSDPKLKDEYVIYTAHWDHLGRDSSGIYHGARDNASGVGGLMEIARAFTKLSPAPKRSIVFLSVTAEEQGLLGSKYYAENPIYPLKKTLADINMDEVNVIGPSKDMTIVGYGNSTLDDIAADILKAHGRTIAPDPEPEKGSFYRSDHFEFAKQGVPAFNPDFGNDIIGKPAGYGQQRREEYTAKHYHKPADTIMPEWDLSGAVEDLKVFFEMGLQIANGDKFPEWKPGAEFKAKREEMLK